MLNYQYTACSHQPKRIHVKGSIGVLDVIRGPARAFTCSKQHMVNTGLTRRRRHIQITTAYKVAIEHAGGTTDLEIEEGETILESALSAGIDLSHDCKMGVCMTCPAKLIEGKVDQSAGMLDEEVKEKGYALLCVSEPQSDCRIKIIDEEEILEEVLCSSGSAG